MVAFLVANFRTFFFRKNRLKICHQKFITFFTLKFARSKENCHLVLTLGALSRNISCHLRFADCHPRIWTKSLVGLKTQTQNAAFFERKGPERKPWPRGKSFNRKKRSQCVF